MTRQQVRQIYGEPGSVSSNPQGEIWFYGNRVHGRDFIPVYGAFAKHEGGSISFDSAGRVKDYNWGNVRYGGVW